MPRRYRLREIASQRGITVKAMMTEAFDKHETDDDVADDIGVHVNTVRRYRRLHDIKPRRGFVLPEAEHASP